MSGYQDSQILTANCIPVNQVLLSSEVFKTCLGPICDLFNLSFMELSE